MKKVTVLMAFYNEDPSYVKINIESILNQTYKDFDFLIISDNPENTVLNNLARSFEEKDSRVRFLQNERNLGIPGAKNRGLKECGTEYIAISDADDCFRPDRLEVQISFLETHPDVVAVGSYGRVIDSNGKVIGKIQRSEDDKHLKTMLPFEQPVFHPVMTFRRIIAGTPVMYDDNMKISLDYEICVRLSDHKFYNIPDYLFDYRISPNQTTQRYSDKYIYYDGPVRKRALEKFYCGITANEEDAFISMYYGNKMDYKELDGVYLFIKNLYFNNLNNDKVYIDRAIDYLIAKFYDSLRSNTSLFYSLKTIIKLYKDIEGKPFSAFMQATRFTWSRVKILLKFRFISK